MHSKNSNKTQMFIQGLRPFANLIPKNLKKYINEWDGNKNLVFVTHYVVISEALNYTPNSGEIVISNIRFKKIGNIEIEY